MSKNSSEIHQEVSSDNWFTRHPVTTISVLMTFVLFFCLLALELFLKTFSGLGNPPLYKLSPLYGYRLKANQVINPKGGIGFLYGARLTTNNLGLRAADDWDSNPEGKILFLGDSVTYGGQYIDDGQLFSSVAGRRLPGWQIGNGANNAWGIGNIVGLMKDYGFSPAEVVVTSVIEGDFYRGTTRASSMPLWTAPPRFALQNLLMHFIWKANQSRYGGPVGGVRSEVHLDKIVDKATKRLKDLDDYLKNQHVKHFIFVLPTRSQILDIEPLDARIKLLLKKYEIDAEYLLPKLLTLEPDKNKRRKWFHDEAHLEVSGHLAYGLLIGDLLSKDLL
ncbi:hypothetical protein ACFLZ5_09505 [Thermodesulfobacteriota bacterium]